MNEFTHKEVAFKAIQVGRPYVNVSRAFPLSRRVNEASGKFSYFQVLDRPGGKVQRANETDWVLFPRISVAKARRSVMN